MRLESLGNSVLFEFIDDQKDGMLRDKTTSGIILTAADTTQQNDARWGRVLSVGPQVRDIEPDEYVLVDALKWTNGVELDGQTYWKTDDTNILAASKEPQYKY